MPHPATTTPRRSALRPVIDSEHPDGDWLTSYLSSTKYARDPKLSSGKAVAQALEKKAKSDKKAGSPVRGVGLTGGLRQSLSKNHRRDGRRSWAAPVSPALNIIPAPPISSVVSSSQAQQQKPSSTASPGAGKGATYQDFTAQPVVASAYVGGAVAKAQQPGISSSRPAAAAADGGGSGGVGGPEDWLQTKKAPSHRRMSLTGRRQSMDYAELDAVRERLTHAASLWAVADDENEEEEVEEANAGKTQRQGSTLPSSPPASKTTVGSNNTSTSSSSSKGRLGGGLFRRWMSRPSKNAG